MCGVGRGGKGQRGEREERNEVEGKGWGRTLRKRGLLLVFAFCFDGLCCVWFGVCCVFAEREKKKERDS